MQPSFPPDSAPLVVDRVEWVPASPEAVHVHLLGRWRDRPVSDPLILLVGSESGRRDPFPALEDPAPGVLAAFAVPAELRGRLAADLALAVGDHELALPGAVTGTLPADAVREEEKGRPAEVIDRAVLAERRARRAEMAEESLERRASEAERTVGTLEAQLANLEQRLGQARDERDELQAQLDDAERRLRAAQQREYAEQQSRIEAQDETERVRREHEHAVSELRRRLEAANGRAEDMAREVDRARRGIAEALQRSEADRAALRRVEEQLRTRNERVLAGEASMEAREQLEASLREVSGLAEELRDALASEQEAHAQAERALAAAREEAAGQVDRLERELEARAELQARVAEQLAVVRRELDAIRAEAADREGAARSVEHLTEIADRLKDRIVALERRRDAVEAELHQTRDLLTARSTELERARIDLQHAERDAEVARADAARHHAALEQAQRTIEVVRASAGELQLRLDDERRERAHAEAALHEQLSRAEAEGRQASVSIEIELRAAIEAERRAFAEQVASVERHVAGLREQVAGAAAELRDALDAEQAARQAAERQLAEARDRAATERTAAAEALAQLAIEQARRRELEDEIAQALEGVRGVRAEDEARAARDAAVQQLVGEVLGTAASLRAAFEEESRKLEGELTAVVAQERARMAAELADMQARAERLEAQLEGAGETLATELEAERQARWLAEAEVARLRQAAGRAPEAIAETEAPAARTLIADLDEAAERLREQAEPAEPAAPAHDAPAVAAPEGSVPLAARVTAAPPALPWLATAAERLEPETAARLLVALLPVQRLRVDRRLAYDLTVTELGTFRVGLDGEATVEPRTEPGPRREVDFHLEGPARALAPLAAGGARRRPGDTHFDGSRRSLRRLLRAMRAPVVLSEIARSGAEIEPGLVLCALAAATAPALIDGHTFAVAWDVAGRRGGTWTVRAQGGALAVEPGLPPEGATATVHVGLPAFLPLLAGFAPPAGEGARVSGNLHAVELLRQWFDAAQGLRAA